MFKPTLIISGGQTGADQAGLRAAERLGIATGGWVPKGCYTEDGEAPWLVTQYGCREHTAQYDYEPRTRLNVQLGDATVIFGRRSPGSNLTERLCQQYEKPCLWVWCSPDRPITFATARNFQLWIVRHQPETLNVAGNRESVNKGIGEAVERFLVEIFS